MKRVLFSLLAMFAVGSLWAQSISIADVEVKQGGTGTIEVQINTDSKSLRGVQFDVILPEGISVDGDATVGSTQDSKFSVDASSVTVQRYRYIMTVFSTTTFMQDGVAVNIPIKADESLAVGTVHEATVTGSNDGEGNPKIAISGVDGATGYDQDDFTFNIKIVENMVVLDENETENFPTPTTEPVKVQVKRSIKANVWNTLCLPFEMTEEQVKATFGEDAVISEYKSCAPVRDEDDNVTSITINFDTPSLRALVACKPYMIKVSTPITYEEGFILENVTISGGSPIQIQAGKGKFIGTFLATETLGDSNTPVVYISNNKFYIATGNSKMKGFRGYFIPNALADYIEYLNNSIGETGAKININVDGETTAIDGINAEQRVIEGVYDLQGRKVMVKDGDINNLQRGIYIINGKKVAIK